MVTKHTTRNEKERLAAITRRIEQLKATIGRSSYEVGALLAQVLDGEIYKAGGHRTFDDYLAEEVELSRATAYKLIEVARSFGRALAAELGPEKLNAVLRYLALTRVDEDPKEIPKLSIPVAVDGKVTKKPLRGATLREIERANRELARKQNDRGRRGSAEADALVERASAALERAKVEGPRLWTTWSKREKAHVLRIDGIKVADVAMVLAILLRAVRVEGVASSPRRAG